MGEVLSVDESVQILIGHRTFRVGEFAEAIRMQLEYGTSGWTSDKDAWFSEDGIPCEVLKFTANGWQKGKVRISLEFCPHDSEDEHEYESASFEDELVLAAPTYSEDELDLIESPLSMDDGLEGVGASISMDMEDEPDLVEQQINDELDLEIPAASTNDHEQELGPLDPTVIYVEMELEASTLDPDDELYNFQMPVNLDDELDLGEISQSIEEELELVEEPAASDDELLDLGDMSMDGNDEFDFGEMSAGGEVEFHFGDISSAEKLEDDETDSLLDDVWQDMNEASWQNNQY